MTIIRNPFGRNINFIAWGVDTRDTEMWTLF